MNIKGVEMVNVKINGKWDILLPKHRADRPEWYTEKGWEKPRLNSLNEHLGANDILFYVGAEEGDMPALCQMWGAKVALFEPNPKVWANIKAIWDANNLAYPYSFVGFASDRSTSGGIYHNNFPECAEGEIISNHGFLELRDRNAPEITLDKFSELVDMVPTAISMDVEGSEWHVLKGAEQLILKHHPKLWVSVHPEFMFSHFGEYSYDMRNWIKDRGYTETFLDYQHELHVLYLPI